MNLTPHNPPKRPTRLAGACLLGLGAVAALALLPRHAHACGLVSWPPPPRAKYLHVIWPHHSATNVPIDTQIWLDARGFHRVRLVRTDTDEDVPLTNIHAFGDFSNASYTYLEAPEQLLEPETSYTLHLTLDGNTTTLTFSTAQRSATTSPPDVPPPRVYRDHSVNTYSGPIDGPNGCSQYGAVYNTVRFVEVAHPPTPHPILYVVDDDTNTSTKPHLVNPAQPDPTPSPFYIRHEREEVDHHDDPCLTLRWFDPFGNEGALGPICNPDACLESEHPYLPGKQPDVARFTRAQCGDLPDDAASQRSGSDESAGCATAPHQPSPALPPLALIALCAWCLRRGRTAP